MRQNWKLTKCGWIKFGMLSERITAKEVILREYNLVHGFDFISFDYSQTFY